jgi:hypothetical protein
MNDPMSPIRTHSDIAGRLIAFLILLAGIGVLLFVFVTALHLFQAPVPGLALPVAKGAAPPPAANIGAALALFVRQLFLLALMTVAGSLIAGKGIHLYFGTSHGAHESAPAPPVSRNGHAVEPPAGKPAHGLETAPSDTPHSQGE